MVGVSTAAPHPRPGPASPPGPDVDELRSAFNDLLAGSASPTGEYDEDSGAVADHQVEALDAAHELLARAITELDSGR